ncbi:hypothetical protein TNCV_4972491 [Trichonephila clavipes]|nr:hypothetical protein TNCV_4972491 [Trichonephila clavipes]
MVGNVFVMHWVTLFTLTLEDTNLNHLSCHHPQRNMERLTNTKLADMHLAYELTEENARVAERLYCERYPHKDASDRRLFTKLQHNLCE